jgi:hypothetical protein
MIGARVAIDCDVSTGSDPESPAYAFGFGEAG